MRGFGGQKHLVDAARNAALPWLYASKKEERHANEKRGCSRSRGGPGRVTAGRIAPRAGGRRQRGPACTITGTAGDDVLHGTSGPDVICGKGGNDQINAMGGNDIVFAGPGLSDIVQGAGGADILRGGPGSDIMYGGNGRDVLYGGPGVDDLRGDQNRDRLLGGGGNDGCLHAIDAHPGDRVNGGSGTDTADRDNGDILTSVEIVTKLVCYGG